MYKRLLNKDSRYSKATIEVHILMIQDIVMCYKHVGTTCIIWLVRSLRCIDNDIEMYPVYGFYALHHISPLCPECTCIQYNSLICICIQYSSLICTMYMFMCIQYSSLIHVCTCTCIQYSSLICTCTCIQYSSLRYVHVFNSL